MTEGISLLSRISDLNLSSSDSYTLGEDSSCGEFEQNCLAFASAIHEFDSFIGNHSSSLSSTLPLLWKNWNHLYQADRMICSLHDGVTEEEDEDEGMKRLLETAEDGKQGERQWKVEYDSPTATPEWLFQQCMKVHKFHKEQALSLALTILSVCQTHFAKKNNAPTDTSFIALQDDLLNILGHEEDSTLQFLFDLVPIASEIASQVTSESLYRCGDSRSTQTDTLITDHHTIHRLHREKLHKEAIEAIAFLVDLKLTHTNKMTTTNAHDSDTRYTPNNGVTHTLISRSDEKELQKEIKRAMKKAILAVENAQKEGVLLDPRDPTLVSIAQYFPDLIRRFTTVSTANHALSSLGRDHDLIFEEEMLQEQGRGLLEVFAKNRLDEMTSQLLPENSRQYYQPKGLPAGTERKWEDGYEIVTIPPPTYSVYTSTTAQRIVLSEVMNPKERKAFEGTLTLNPMQSVVFHAAFHTRENLLICAPTGAGKTNVAMLAVVAHLRNVGILSPNTVRPGSEGEENPYAAYQHIQNNSAKSGAPMRSSSMSNIAAGTKIVYIAPMKALAQEVVTKFSAKLSPMNIVVRELTGDMQLSRSEAERSDILVTTPEKWDVITRKGGSDGTLAQSCGLLLIDEVHLLADESRGAVIESIVARLHRLIESTQRHVRIVALSATLPNYEDIAEFLRVEKTKGLFYFGPEYRPVPLKQKFIGVTSASTTKVTTVPTSDTNSDMNVGSSDTNTAKTSASNRWKNEAKMNEICYEVVIDSLRRGYQVMIFVHSRKGAGETARAIADIARKRMELGRYFVTVGDKEDFDSSSTRTIEAYSRFVDKVNKSRNREVAAHFANGMGIHHAGMLRADRKLSESMFEAGAIRVLCCTATLAWGVNLPAHTVIIKGTDVYNPEKGRNCDLSILDVMQIFGRAGRPQFDTSGEAILITAHDALQRYLDKLVREVPIESNFIKQLGDHLNAEIVGGTVSNVTEACQWLRYTYLYVRMRRNSLAYGITADQRADDPFLSKRVLELVTGAAKVLDSHRMIRYDPNSGNVSITDLGRVAAHFYLETETIATFNEMFERMVVPSDADMCHMICCAHEFENVKVRSEELSEMDKLNKKEWCPLTLKGPLEDFSGKCCVLLQAYVSNAKLDSFTLISDSNYIISNAGRVARALFEMCLKRGNSIAAFKLLRIAKCIDKRIWWWETPLRQFEGELPLNVFKAIENLKAGKSSPDTGGDMFDTAISLLDMQPGEVGELCHWFKGGEKIQRLVEYLPRVDICCNTQPITRGILRFQIELIPCFKWNARWHGGAQGFWLWVEDGESNKIYHHEYIVFAKHTHREPLQIEMTIPAFEPLPTQYFIRLISDSWVGSEMIEAVSIKNMLMPVSFMPYSDLIDLTPLPITALNDTFYEQIYRNRSIEKLNPIQTQLFHVLYHTDTPVLLGAPTGSGKTMVAEIAIMRMKRINRKHKCVYIAPLKSLARERLKEWRDRFGLAPLHWNVLELSGDTHHDNRTLNTADILVCTPEKWDLISRGWRGDVTKALGSPVENHRRFISDVRLLIIDEIHLLGEERGAVLESIVSRTRFISQFIAQHGDHSSDQTGLHRCQNATRIIGLSTAIANPYDLADWIGIKIDVTDGSGVVGLYNFRPSVRPVPMVVHISGFAGRHYCPRMATMNKPAYAAIKQHSPKKPVIIFVASRRQTRLTALDLISYAASDDNPRAFLGCDDEFIGSVAMSVSDASLRHTISFGIGLHHAGLSSHDRETVERMFLSGVIQVLVATATLAWGVNLPAHLVVVKGTEYFDGKTNRYVDYPVTDVLQMIGRAGRPQFDTEGISCVFVEESKKNFYKKFLYEPFPIESNFASRMIENINAEIAIGTINIIADCVSYLSWTFFARRVKVNPSYYGAASSKVEDIDQFFLDTVRRVISELSDLGCITVDKDARGNLETFSAIQATTLGRASASFYLRCKTALQMNTSLKVLRRMILPMTERDPISAAQLREGEHAHCIISRSFILPDEVGTAGVASILYYLSHTCEFDELPVRHNEENLNAVLAEQVPWGLDLKAYFPRASISTDRDLDDIMKDPHTKCYLLLQAYVVGAKLPISDYENDTRSVVEQIPRLLAAMQYIFLEEKESYGSFILTTFFPLVRKFLKRKSVVKSPSRSNIISLKNIKLSYVAGNLSGKGTGLIRFEIDMVKTLNTAAEYGNLPNELNVSVLLGTTGNSLLAYKSDLVLVSSKMGASKIVELSFNWDDSRLGKDGQSPKVVILRLICEDMPNSDFDYIVPFLE